MGDGRIMASIFKSSDRINYLFVVIFVALVGVNTATLVI